MNAYYVADQILQYSLNALIGFLILAALTAFSLKIFQIRSPRVRATLRLAPSLRLMLEPLFLILPFSFAPVNISLFSCSHPWQIYFYNKLSEASKLELSRYGLKSTLGKVLLFIPETLLWVAIAAFLGLVIVRVAKLANDFIQSIISVNRIKRTGILISSFDNHKQQALLQNHKIDVYTSANQIVPYAGWGKVIILPDPSAKGYSKEELEAVLAHEIEHILRYDIFTRFVGGVARAIYWWIPLKRWNSLIEQEQEMACDAAIHSYALDKLNLATALQKSLLNDKSVRSRLLAAFSSQGTQIIRRLQAILSSESEMPQNKLTMYAAIIFLTALIPFVTFVIC